MWVICRVGLHNLKTNQDDTNKLAHKLERSVEFFKGSVEQADEELDDLKTQRNLEISSLNRKLLYLEAYSKKRNPQICEYPCGVK